MKIVCEFSGGADSIYATILTKKRWPGAEITGVFVDYGQICKEQEYNKAVKCAQRLDIKLKKIKVEDVWNGGGMIDGETDSNDDVYTPIRNVAILGLVMSDRKSVVQGKSVDLGGRRIIKKKTDKAIIIIIF